MATTKRSDLIYTDQLQDAISAEFAGRKALAGTAAVVMNMSLPGDARGGDTLKVPYFVSIGELEDVAEGQALTPVKLTETSETATVQRSGKAGEITTWAKLTAMFSDPYAELAKQFADGWIRRIDLGLITKAAATDLIVDNNATAVNPDMFIDLNQLFGDEQDSIALYVIHSQILTALRKTKTSGSGEYIIQWPTAPNVLPTLWGKPVIMSDRLPTTGSGSSTVYTSLAAKRGALAAWVNGTPVIDTDKDILTDSQLSAVNMYWLAHMYGRTPGQTTKGVAKLLSRRV